MQLHELKPTKKRSTSKRIGRGGKRGKTSGKGHKGQKARAGNSSRPEMREIIKKLPKLRGHGINRAKTVHSGRVRPTVINLALLEKAMGKETEVSPKTLIAVGVLKASKKNLPKVKILGNGEVTKKFKVTNCEVSASAKAKLEKAGGSVVV